MSKKNKYKNICGLMAAVLLLLLPACAPKKMDTLSLESELNIVRKVSVDREGDESIVSIDADSTINYTAFKLTDPLRVVVDINGADVRAVEGVSYMDGSTVEKVIVTQYGEEEGNIGRIEITLKESVEYNIEREGSSLKVVFAEMPLLEAEARI